MQTSNDVRPAAPIFFVCSERSGSNLTSSIVGEHPDAYAHPPYDLGRDLIVRLHDVAEGGASSAAMQVLKQRTVNRVSKSSGEPDAARVGDWLDRFGYPGEYSGIAKSRLFSMLEPQLTEPLERLINRESRAQYKAGNRRLKAELDAAVDPLLLPLWDAKSEESY